MATTRNKDGTKSHATDLKVCVTCGIEFRARRRYWPERPTRFCSNTCYRARIEPQHNKKPLGSRTLGANGYVLIKIAEGLLPWTRCWKREHVLVAEQALGRLLKEGECVHHINGIKADNRNNNLLVCERGFHRYLHERMASLYQQEHFTLAPG